MKRQPPRILIRQADTVGAEQRAAACPKKTVHATVYLGLALILLGSPPAWSRSQNIVLMIGDGMGMSVLGFGQMYSEEILRTPSLYIQEAMRLGRMGLVTTRSARHWVTDSAASATAMACGVATVNDRVGMDETRRPLKNIFETAQEKGLSVGLVTTDRLTGATPAAFSAHVDNRRQNREIGAQQVHNRVTVLLGGGEDDFDMAEARRVGYWIMRRKADLLNARAEKRPMWLGVFAPGELSYQNERSPDHPSLPEMTHAALEHLAQDQDGFVLVIEGARIDHAAHANETQKAVGEYLEFDDTLGVVMKFIKNHPDTTVFVTADHDTGGGGMTRSESGDYPASSELSGWPGVRWLSQHHTAEPVILVGFGPDADEATGWHPNIKIYSLMKNALGL